MLKRHVYLSVVACDALAAAPAYAADNDAETKGKGREETRAKATRESAGPSGGKVLIAHRITTKVTKGRQGKTKPDLPFSSVPFVVFVVVTCAQQTDLPPSRQTLRSKHPHRLPVLLPVLPARRF